jgi:erythromycin esterase-like protein
MSQVGELNGGQLMRQRYDRSATLIGFSTYAGEVFAASSWGEHGRAKPLPPARPGSVPLRQG